MLQSASANLGVSIRDHNKVIIHILHIYSSERFYSVVWRCGGVVCWGVGLNPDKIEEKAGGRKERCLPLSEDSPDRGEVYTCAGGVDLSEAGVWWTS